MTNLKDLNVNVFKLFAEEWGLVTAGNQGHYNTMTIGWGTLGTIWKKDVATVYVKPCRYTYEFMEENDYFTISFFDKAHRKDLALLGAKSGRDGDKVAETTLTPVAMAHDTVGFEEATLTIICKKIYSEAFKEALLPADVVQQSYAEEAPHQCYIGEVVEIIEK